MPQKSAARQGFNSNPFEAIFRAALERGLEDDGWSWDWTTLGALRSPDQKIHARIVAKSEGIWAGDALTAALGRLDGSIRVSKRIRDGGKLEVGATLMEWHGPARSILAFERPFLNLASYVGGIATKTEKLVSAARKACPKGTPRVTPTRKTLPGYRDIAIYGVMAGGGFSHRVSLSGGVLIKENHIATAGGISRAIEGARQVAPHGLLIEIEVRSLAELKQALKAGADGVLLDNFSPAEVHSALALVRSAKPRQYIKIEVSGGISEKNIGQYAIPGVDVISSGSLTHSVDALDLSLLVSS